MIKREYFDCACGTTDHTVAICWVPNDENNPYDDELYFEMQLHRETNIFKRAWNAMKYVFGFDYRSHWGECVLRVEEAKRMRLLLDEFVKVADKKDT